MTRKFLGGSIRSKILLRSFGFDKMLLRSLGGKSLAGAVCLLAAVCLQAPVALAQHGGFGGGAGHSGGGGGGHFGGGGTHSAPRGAGASTAKTGSIFHIFHRTTAASGSGVTASRITTPVTLTSSGLLYRPIPHPTPTPQPVFFVPVYVGSPFFYGGFNSFGWGCGPFWGAGCFYAPFYGAGLGYGWGGYGGYYGGWGGGYTGLGAGSNGYSSYNTDASDSGPSLTSTQSYVAPSHRPDLVELFFKDGSVYDVTDYWVVEGQMHFLTVDERGEKTVEHVLPFDTLDLQTTVDDNNSRGFKFQLRNQSMEQYFREHPEEVPKAVDPEAPEN